MEFNLDKMNETLKQVWVSAEDMKHIYPCGREHRYKMFRKAKEKAIEEKYFIPVCKPPVVPLEVVLELFPLGKKKGS